MITLEQATAIVRDEFVRAGQAAAGAIGHAAGAGDELVPRITIEVGIYPGAAGALDVSIEVVRARTTAARTANMAIPGQSNHQEVQVRVNRLLPGIPAAVHPAFLGFVHGLAEHLRAQGAEVDVRAHAAAPAGRNGE